MSAAAPDRPAPRMRRIAHPGRTVAVLALVLALLTASFVAGRFFQPPPAPDAAAEANAPIDVWAPVERRVVDTGATFAGAVVAGATRDVAVTTEGPAVVLRRAASPGQRVRPGDLAGEVSGRAYVFLPEPLALYRDLTEGDRGRDVESLQRALKRTGRWTPTDGVLGESTARAVRELFRSADAPLPADEPVAVQWRQFIPLPEDGATVTAAAEYGDTLKDDVPLLRLQTSPPSVHVTADVTQAAGLKPGQAVRVAAGARTVPGSITKVGEFQAGKDGGRSGHTVEIALDDPAALPPVGQSITVTTSTGSEADTATLAVPQTAIRADGSGSVVLVQQGDADRRIPVTVLRTGGGWAAVTGDLAVGDRVKVS